MIPRAPAKGLTAAALAFLASGLAADQDPIIVTPRCLTLLPGQTCAFRARRASDSGGGAERTQGGATWRWSLADGDPGAIHPATGLYTAPPVTGIQRVRVRAAPASGVAGEPVVPGEALVTVLPTAPFDLVAKVMGADWLAPHARDYPFLDLATGRRFACPAPARAVRSVQHGNGTVLTGYGLATSLHWQPPSTAVAQLLSFREGDQLVQRDVTGQTIQTLVFRAPVRNCAVEALEPAAAPGAWLSRTYPFRVDVRGVFPFAGNPLTAGDHVDGQGLSARFRQAFAAVWLWQQAPESGTWGLFLVSDPHSHVLRQVSREGRVTTLCGEPGRPGHRDSPSRLRQLGAWLLGADPAPARFNRPTYLVRREVPESVGPPRWETLVADSGNHVLRRVDAAAQVATLAGVPGQAGHRDGADPLAALFHDPQGLAADSRGRVYVADRGNQVIRRIGPDGVTTLAGSPGQAGSRDGSVEDARFQDLKGITWTPSPGPDGDLFVLDGHALRRVGLDDRLVTTLVGQVDRPGFRDVQPPDPLRPPCLRDPAGIRWERERTFLLADRGNHAIRWVDLGRGVLHTLAGDPDAPATRWGLPRDGMPGPLGAEYAALEAPTAVVPATCGTQDGLLVCAGRALAEFHARLADRDLPTLATVTVSPARREEPPLVSFSVITEDARGWPTLRAFHYIVDFLDPCGDLVERHQGEGSSIAPVAVRATFTEPGPGRVRVRCVTDQGVSVGGQATVTAAD